MFRFKAANSSAIARGTPEFKRVKSRGPCALVCIVNTLLLLVFAHPAGAAPGDLDPAFGAAGKVTTDIGSDDRIHAMALQPDGKIVAAGCSPCATSVGTGSDFALARYLPDGSLDPTFGVGGVVTTDFGVEAGDEISAAVALQPDGKIVVAGCAGCFNSTLPLRDFAIARYLPDGTLDPTFGTAGKVTTDFGGGDGALAVVLQPDGKILAAGRTGQDVAEDFGLARYLPDGSLDPSFGSGGKVITDFGGFDTATGLSLYADGRMVAGGLAFMGSTSNEFALARYLPDGTLDPTFGSAGKVTTDFDGDSDGVEALALQPDGRIVVAGIARVGGVASGDSFGLARYLPDGQLDSTFGTGGKLTTQFVDGVRDRAADLAIQPDGKILAAGATSLDVESAFALVRYLPDGTLDPTFGDAGKVTTDFGGNEQFAHALVLQPDAKIIAAGSDKSSGTPDFALARYDAGSPAPTAPPPPPPPTLPPSPSSSPPQVPCTRTACSIQLGCIVILGPETRCIGRIDVFVRARDVRFRDDASTKAPRRIRFAASVVNIAPGETPILNLKVTKPGRKIVRTSKRRTLRGVMQIRNAGGLTNSSRITLTLRRR